MISMLVSSGYS